VRVSGSSAQAAVDPGAAAGARTEARAAARAAAKEQHRVAFHEQQRKDQEQEQEKKQQEQDRSHLTAFENAVHRTRSHRACRGKEMQGGQEKPEPPAASAQQGEGGCSKMSQEEGGDTRSQGQGVSRNQGRRSKRETEVDEPEMELEWANEIQVHKDAVVLNESEQLQEQQAREARNTEQRRLREEKRLLAKDEIEERLQNLYLELKPVQDEADEKEKERQQKPDHIETLEDIEV